MSSFTSSITPLATLQPACTSRTWTSTPHPRLPILATACADKAARIYSLQNFQQQALISGGHKRSVRSCAWKPNSVGESVLVTGSFDASAGIWRRWEERAGEGQREMDFTGRGLSGGQEEAAEEEEDEWRFAVILDGHDSEIKCVSFSPTAPLLATCSRDKSVWIWEELEDDNFETVAVLQEHQGDVKCVAWHPSEPLLASASYDDDVRLWREDVDDWACCARLTGHDGTVWWVEFEGEERKGVSTNKEGEKLTDKQSALLLRREKSGPRLLSCSDDQTIRVWRKVPKEKPELPTGQGSLPSIWKNNDFEEEWIEDSRLPAIHERPIYALSWSRKTGRIVSTGSDGKIVVYEERWKSGRQEQKEGDSDVQMADSDMSVAQTDVTQTGEVNGSHLRGDVSLTEWVAVAQMENAHDVFEINHVCWAARADKGKRYDEEEIIVSTGDDGEVKIWTFDP